MAHTSAQVVGVIAGMHAARPEQRLAAAVIARAFRDAAGRDLSHLPEHRRASKSIQREALAFLRDDARVMAWMTIIAPAQLEPADLRALIDRKLRGIGHVGV